jgi:hypothetical protein
MNKLMHCRGVTVVALTAMMAILPQKSLSQWEKTGDLIGKFPISTLAANANAEYHEKDHLAPALAADNFSKAFNYLLQVRVRDMPYFFAKPFDRKGSDLADFHPGFLGQVFFAEMKGERKSSPLRLTGDGKGDNRSGPLIKNVFADYQNRAMTFLFISSNRIQVGPEDISS